MAKRPQSNRQKDPQSNRQKPPKFTPPTDLLLTAFCNIARPLMLQCMRPESAVASCIGSCRASFFALQKLRLRVEPWAVGWVVQVPSLNYAYVCGLRGEKLREAQNAAGGYRKRELPEGETGWDGHLILIVEDRWVLDPSFDQCAAVPGLEIPPRILMIDTQDPQFRATVADPPLHPRDSTIHAGVVSDNGLEMNVLYWPLDENEADWQETEAWKDRDAEALGAFLVLRTIQYLETVINAVKSPIN